MVPNFRALGPRLGPKMPAVKAALAQADGGAVARELNQCGMYSVVLDGGETFELSADDVEVRAQEHEEFALAQEGAVAVALDLHIDADLRGEGLARELARALNDHRTAIGLALADRIAVGLWADGPVAEAAGRHGQWIAGEVLAVEWHVNGGDLAGDADTLDVEGTPVRVRVTGPGGAPLRSSG